MKKCEDTIKTCKFDHWFSRLFYKSLPKWIVFANILTLPRFLPQIANFSIRHISDISQLCQQTRQ